MRTTVITLLFCGLCSILQSQTLGHFPDETGNTHHHGNNNCYGFAVANAFSRDNEGICRRDMTFLDHVPQLYFDVYGVEDLDQLRLGDIVNFGNDHVAVVTWMLGSTFSGWEDLSFSDVPSEGQPWRAGVSYEVECEQGNFSGFYRKKTSGIPPIRTFRVKTDYGEGYIKAGRKWNLGEYYQWAHNSTVGIWEGSSDNLMAISPVVNTPINSKFQRLVEEWGNHTKPSEL